MKRSFSYGAATSQGHANMQEDGFYLDPSKGFFLLANGAGGRGGSGNLVRELVQSMADLLRDSKDLPELPVSNNSILSGPQNYMFQSLEKIHKKMCEANSAKEWQERGAASLSAAWMQKNNCLHLLNCGSSGALLLRSQKLQPLFLPQLLQSAAPVSIPQQLIGFSAELWPDCKELVLQSGDLVIFYTDGVAQAVENVQDFFLSILQSFPRESGYSLMAQAEAAIQALGGAGLMYSNATVMILEYPLSD